MQIVNLCNGTSIYEIGCIFDYLFDIMLQNDQNVKCYDDVKQISIYEIDHLERGFEKKYLVCSHVGQPLLFNTILIIT